MHFWCKLDRLWSELLGATPAFSSGGFLSVPWLESLLVCIGNIGWSHWGSHILAWTQALSSSWPYSRIKLNPIVTIVEWWAAGVPGLWSITGLVTNFQTGKITIWGFQFSATQPSSSTVPKTEDQRPQLGGCHFVWIMPGCGRVCWTW